MVALMVIGLVEAAGIIALLVAYRKKRQRPYALALQVHDRVLQAIAGARMNFEAGETEVAYGCLDEAMSATKQIVAEVLADAGSLAPGRLRQLRTQPGGTDRWNG